MNEEIETETEEQYEEPEWEGGVSAFIPIALGIFLAAILYGVYCFMVPPTASAKYSIKSCSLSGLQGWSCQTTGGVNRIMITHDGTNEVFAVDLDVKND